MRIISPCLIPCECAVAGLISAQVPHTAVVNVSGSSWSHGQVRPSTMAKRRGGIGEEMQREVGLTSVEPGRVIRRRRTGVRDDEVIRRCRPPTTLLERADPLSIRIPPHRCHDAHASRNGATVCGALVKVVRRELLEAQAPGHRQNRIAQCAGIVQRRHHGLGEADRAARGEWVVWT